MAAAVVFDNTNVNYVALDGYDAGMGKHASLLNGIALNVPFNPKNVKIFLEGIMGSLQQMHNIDRIA